MERCKPILKWAGGKSQLLTELMPRIPQYSGKYIEPFFGGGALYLAFQPENAIIADSNPEIINVYRQVADSVDEVVEKLKQYRQPLSALKMGIMHWHSLFNLEYGYRRPVGMCKMH